MIPENASIRDASVKLSKSPRKRSYCALPAAWVAEIMWECIPPASERSCKGQHKHKLPLWNNPEYENSLPLLSAACQQSRLLSQNAQARLICSPLETRVVPLFPITTWPWKSDKPSGGRTSSSEMMPLKKVPFVWTFRGCRWTRKITTSSLHGRVVISGIVSHILSLWGADSCLFIPDKTKV